MKPETESKIEILKTTFPDSEVKFIESNVNNIIVIKCGYLKKVASFLMDCGVNFKVQNNVIDFFENQLRMIE